MIDAYLNGNKLSIGNFIPYKLGNAQTDIDAMKNDMCILVFESNQRVDQNPFYVGMWFTLFTSTLGGGGFQIAISTNGIIKYRSLNSGQWDKEWQIIWQTNYQPS